MGRRLKTYTIKINDVSTRRVRAFKAQDAKRIIWNDIKHDASYGFKSWEQFMVSVTVEKCQE